MGSSLKLGSRDLGAVTEEPREDFQVNRFLLTVVCCCLPSVVVVVIAAGESRSWGCD